MSDTEFEQMLVTLADIEVAAQRIRGHVVHTPLISLPSGDSSSPLLLKAESMQPVGAFMQRDTFNAILRRIDEAREHGVVAHSSGNHARAVAFAAKELGLSATIVMPDAAPENSVVRALGAEVVIVAPNERDTKALELSRAHGRVLIPPYDDADIVAGQGTVGLEIVDDLTHVDVVLVPVSGGGLIGGMATAIKALLHPRRSLGWSPIWRVIPRNRFESRGGSPGR